jgi:dihydrofolate synthase/folylpolyglutamate synthase
VNFDESYAYLLSLGNEVLAMKLGLTATEKLLAALGNPQKNFTKVQIAGTNGKGSTCAFLEAICRSAQINVGLTTSPHLVSITERVRINGVEISEEKFAEHATRVRAICEKLVETGELENVPTYFEQVTAIAISAFNEAKVDLAILETGLGGRFDSTTAARAEIVGITPINFDHQQILGNTLALIAAEKAAIIRKDTKVIVAGQKAEAEKVIIDVCQKLGVKPQTTDFEAEILGIDETKHFVVNFQTPKASYKNVHLNLLGRHQIENAKTAILLAESLQENFKIASENITQGLQTAIHEGRLEFREGILFDGAHNAAGANALGAFLDEFIQEKITLVFGAMRDKDLSEIAQILFPKAERLIFTEPDSLRSMGTEELVKYLPEDFDKNKVYISHDVADALRLADKVSQNNLICVTGSLYLVGEAQRVLSESS